MAVFMPCFREPSEAQLWNGRFTILYHHLLLDTPYRHCFLCILGKRSVFFLLVIAYIPFLPHVTELYLFSGSRLGVGSLQKKVLFSFSLPLAFFHSLLALCLITEDILWIYGYLWVSCIFSERKREKLNETFRRTT